MRNKYLYNFLRLHINNENSVKRGLSYVYELVFYINSSSPYTPLNRITICFGTNFIL